MAKKPTDKNKKTDHSAFIAGAGDVQEQAITDTLKTNYMPYALSVIMSRAIPEIDGFKPSHRKLLYTMYKMGLLTGGKTKSANIVGQTMRLNPHGDAAIYETMVRLARGNEALLHPYVDSKGNFGKFYSRDMAYAASRYTEAKLDVIASELFRDIEKDTVDFVDNYDATMLEPTLLPVTFPAILVNSNTGIAVGMASQICPFNLTEICEAEIAYLRDENCDLFDTVLAPDFPGGGKIIYNRDDMAEIYETGRGGIKIRADYTYDKSSNCIDITEIPPTTTIEGVIESVIDGIKKGKIKEISDIRDETGLGGLKITIDLKRGVDPDALMSRLFRQTTLEGTFRCNFNLIVSGAPRVMGIREILIEWTAFRRESVKRRIYFDLNKKQDKLHLLKGLAKILMDIDKAIKIVRETDEEQEVVPNLMIGFGIDEIQAEYVAEIKLRHLNREYILNRLKEVGNLEAEIAELSDILNSNTKIKAVIIGELRDVIKKYSVPRKTKILYGVTNDNKPDTPEIPGYPVTVFFTRDGYFKKITPQSLRMSGEQKLKEGDSVVNIVETLNSAELLFFTNRRQVYKARVGDFEDGKASVLGVYIAQRLGFEEGEVPVYMAVTSDYAGYMLFFFENGKVAKVEMSAYATKLNRKKLLKAYSDKANLACAVYITDNADFLLKSSGGRMLLFSSAVINSKTTKDTQGVSVMNQRKGHRLISAETYTEDMLQKPHRYRAKTLPSMGALPGADEMGEQLLME